MATEARTMNAKGTAPARSRRTVAPRTARTPAVQVSRHARPEEAEHETHPRMVVNITEVNVNLGLPFVVQGPLVMAARGARRALRFLTPDVESGEQDMHADADGHAAA